MEEYNAWTRPSGARTGLLVRPIAENKLGTNWTKWLLRAWIVLSLSWTLYVISQNYENISINKTTPPDNTTLLQSIEYWNKYFAAEHANTYTIDPDKLKKALSSSGDLIYISPDPMATGIELHGFGASTTPSQDMGRRIVLPYKYANKKDTETLIDIISAFNMVERDRKVNLINRVIVNIVWPVMFSAIVFYMTACLISGRKGSKNT